MSDRTYHDPLHGGIVLDKKDRSEAMVIALIDASPFQRLRRIRQLGPAFLTFHGAESSRFTHSLGVFHLARRALNRLIKFNKGLEEFRGILYGAALLHDVGHGPLSHTGEEMFGLKHEAWSSRLVREHPDLRNILEAYKPGTANAIGNLLEGKEVPHPSIKALISSQLDCDRLDYLLRDSYSTGTNFGNPDLDRILLALTIAPDEGLAIHPKGLIAVEHYLIVRNLMYRSVYNHRLNEVCTWLLEQIVKLARELGPNQIWADKSMAKWLWEPNEINLETFLANDDLRTGYHLIHWKEEGPEQLSELCSRLLNRNLLKAIEIRHLSNCEQLEALAFARNLVERDGQDPSFSCGLRHAEPHGYHPYIGGLRLWDGKDLTALETKSPLVESLIDPIGSTWLIHPREVHQELKDKVQKLQNNS